MQRVEDSELETMDGVTYRWQGERFTGIGYVLNDVGKLIDEISYKNGRQDGVSRQWNGLGQLFFETHYRKGAPYGLDREWDENGQLRDEAFLEYSFPAWEKQWDENGQLIKDHVMGPEDSNYGLLQSSRAAYDKVFGMDKGKPLPPEPVSHEALRGILEAHAAYVATQGKEGKEADLSLLLIEDYDFSNLNLAGVHFHASVFLRCRFVNTDLYYTEFDAVKAPQGNFQGAMLAKASFYEADLSGACFDEAKLTSASFLKSDLRRATFRSAEIDSTSFTDSNLTDVIFDPTVPRSVREGF